MSFTSCSKHFFPRSGVLLLTNCTPPHKPPSLTACPSTNSATTILTTSDSTKPLIDTDHSTYIPPVAEGQIPDQPIFYSLRNLPILFNKVLL